MSDAVPCEGGVMVVWSIAGMPLWAGAVGSAAGLSTELLRWDLNGLGSLVSGMTALFGHTRLSRVTFASPSRARPAVPVDVIACRGVLCIVAVVTQVASANDAPPNQSCLDHPLAPLLLMAVSLLEPLCRDEGAADDNNSDDAQRSAPNPLLVANPFAAKTTPTNSLCMDAATPGAPVKHVPPPDTPAREAAGNGDNVRADAFQPRWRAVTQTLLNAAANDAARRRQAEALSGKQVLQEGSSGLLIGECLDSQVPIPGTAQELVDTMTELLELWHVYFTQQCGKALWIISSTLTPNAAGHRVDNVHPKSARKLYCPSMHRWLRVQLPTPTSQGPLLLPPNAVRPEGLEPVCTPLQIAEGEQSDVVCIALVKGAHSTPTTMSVVMSDLHKAAGWAAGAVRDWNALAAMATAAF